MSLDNYLRNYTIIFTESAKKDLKKIDRSISKIIEKKIEQLTLHSDRLDIKKLVGFKDPTYRLRINDYRVIYEIKNDEIVILVIAIKHRKDVYKI